LDTGKALASGARLCARSRHDDDVKGGGRSVANEAYKYDGQEPK